MMSPAQAKAPLARPVADMPYAQVGEAASAMRTATSDPLAAIAPSLGELGDE